MVLYIKQFMNVNFMNPFGSLSFISWLNFYSFLAFQNFFIRPGRHINPLRAAVEILKNFVLAIFKMLKTQTFVFPLCKNQCAKALRKSTVGKGNRTLDVWHVKIFATESAKNYIAGFLRQFPATFVLALFF